MGPIPGIVIKPRRLFMLPRARPDLPVESVDLLVELVDPLEQQPSQLDDRLRQATRLVLENPGQLHDPGPALRSDHAVLGQVTPKRIDRLRALAHQEVARAKEHPLRLLRLGLDRHEVHGRSLRRFRDRLRVSRVVLAALDEGLHVDRGDQPHFVAERRDLPAPVVGTGARPHRYRTPRLRGEKAQQLPAAQLLPVRYRPIPVRPVYLKAALCQIDPDDANLFHVDASPPSDGRLIASVPSWHIAMPPGGGVHSIGTRSWIQRLVIRGRKRELGLGSVQLVSLAEAREQALANRKLARAGGDPPAEKRRLVGVPTFAEAAKRVVEQKRAGWRSAAHARNWFRTVEIHAFPRIGDVAVSEVTSADVLEILTPIWHTKAPTARFVHMRVRAVLEWAIAMEWRTDNPCDRILHLLGPQHDVVTHHRALPHGEVAAAIGKVRAAEPGGVDTLAFEFMVLTTARGAEVRGAVWNEMDQDSGVWTIPASRMKTAREQRVPLCGRALEILEAARRLGDGKNPVVFVSESGVPLATKRLNRLLGKHGIAAVPHGFRSSFRDWAAEKTDHPREVVEAALAHVVKSKVEAAYMRTDLFERRRRLMDDWAAYLAGGET